MPEGLHPQEMHMEVSEMCSGSPPPPLSCGRDEQRAHPHFCTAGSGMGQEPISLPVCLGTWKLRENRGEKQRT